MNDNPATILVLSPGVYGMNSNTHIALCDIQEFSHVPNLIYLVPSCKEEYNIMGINRNDIKCNIFFSKKWQVGVIKE